VRDKVTLAEGRPLDPANVERARARIDSLYHARGYYLERTKPLYVYEKDSSGVPRDLDVEEGNRVAIAQVDFQGNTHFTDEQLATQMSTRPEGLWWFRSASTTTTSSPRICIRSCRRSTASRVCGLSGARRHADRVRAHREGDAGGEGQRGGALPDRHLRDRGQPALLDRGPETFYPFAGRCAPAAGSRRQAAHRVFRRPDVAGCTRKLQTLYYNNGYIYVNVRPDVLRRIGPDGKPVVDLRWVITEGQPAIVSHVEIRGNDVTHDRVIREAIVMVPGDVFRQDALLASYSGSRTWASSISRCRSPTRSRRNEQGDIDVVFRVSEKRTGNINFGASVVAGHGGRRLPRPRRAEPVRTGQARPVPVAVRQEHQ